MSNYKRNSSSFSSDSFFISELERNFKKELEKVSVEVASKSVYDQINEIMGNKKSKHSSVAAAVEEMKSRSGLTDYLKRADSNAVASTTKVAQVAVKVFEVAPQVKYTLDNYIHDTRGHMSIPAIVDFIKTIHRSDVENETMWKDPSFVKYVEDRCKMELDNHVNKDDMNRNLGKVNDMAMSSDLDPSNTDAFHCLQPASGK